MSCPICQKRKPGRFCPAKAEQICPVCCGTEREITIDCPSDCAYLLSAHRYEDQHTRPVPPDTPLLDVRLSSDIVQRHPRLLSGLAFTIAKFRAAQPATSDPDVLAAIQALAQSYKTLAAGIVYEQPPTGMLQHQLYDALAAYLAEVKQQPGKVSSGPIQDADIFHLLVFLFRMGLVRSNGRPRSRRFVEFLHSQVPTPQELKHEEPRIIVP